MIALFSENIRCNVKETLSGLGWFVRSGWSSGTPANELHHLNGNGTGQDVQWDDLTAAGSFLYLFTA